MSRIRQYEPIVPPSAADASRVLGYDPLLAFDPYAEFVTLCIQPSVNEISAFSDSLGNAIVSPGQCLSNPAPFNFGTEDFTIELSRYQYNQTGYGVPSQYWYYYPIMQQVGGIEFLTVTSADQASFRVWNGTWFEPVMYVEVSEVGALYNKFFHIAISRSRGWLYMHLNGRLIEEKNVGLSHTLPFSSNPFYFTTCQAENGNRYNVRPSHSRSVRVTSGVARYSRQDNGPDFIDTLGTRVAAKYPPHVPKRRPCSFFVGSGPISQELGCRAFPAMPVRAGFNPKDHSPALWYDPSDAGRLSYDGLLPHPARLVGKPGAERKFDGLMEGQQGIYYIWGPMPSHVKTGIMTSVHHNSVIPSDNFALYFVFSLGGDNNAGGFHIASTQQGTGYVFINSFSYVNGKLSIEFRLGTTDLGYQALFTKEINYPIIDGAKPSVAFIKRFGGNWEIGIDSQVNQFYYTPSNFLPELRIAVSPQGGTQQIFHELVAFVDDPDFVGAKHGQILEYFRAKHGVEYAVSKESIPLDVEFCSGAVCDMGDVFFQEDAGLPKVRSADNLIYGRAQEASYYSPEDQLDLVFNIDMSDESCLALDASGGVVGYRDKFSGRKFRAVANWGNPIPRAAASWNCRWPIYVPATGESKYYFRSTQRYSANPTGNNLFFVGRPPTVLLSQGISQCATYTSYYGFRFNIVDPWRDANRYHALAIKTEGEWGWQYSYEPIYDFAYTYHQLPADFLPTGLLVEDGSVTAPCVICYSMQGSLKIYINGVDVFPSYYTNLLEWPTGDALDVFGTNLGMSAMTAECGQAMLVDGALSVGDIQKVSAQLAYKWGIIDRFAPDFPYRNTPPTP